MYDLHSLFTERLTLPLTRVAVHDIERVTAFIKQQQQQQQQQQHNTPSLQSERESNGFNIYGAD